MTIQDNTVKTIYMDAQNSRLEVETVTTEDGAVRILNVWEERGNGLVSALTCLGLEPGPSTGLAANLLAATGVEPRPRLMGLHVQDVPVEELEAEALALLQLAHQRRAEGQA